MWKWMKENIFVKDMFLYIILAGIIFYSPSWITFIIGITAGKDVLVGFSATYILIWAGPFTPTIPAILAIAVAIKQLVKRIRRCEE